MGIKIYRTTYKLGASRAVTLPSAWCNYYGDRIKTLTIIGNSVLVLAPEGLENTAQALIEQFEKQGSLK